jgi:hypothetical protein
MSTQNPGDGTEPRVLVPQLPLQGRELMLKRVHGLFRSDKLVAALAAAPHPALAVLEIARLAVAKGVHASDPRGTSPIAVGEPCFATNQTISTTRSKYFGLLDFIWEP